MVLWISVGLMVVCVPLAWLVMKLLVNNTSERKGIASVVFILAYGAFNGFCLNVVMPKVVASQNAKQLESSLLANPLFAALKEHDPTAFASLLYPLQQATREGASLAEVSTLASNATRKLVKVRVAQSSNESAVKYMTAYSQILTAIQNKDLEACHQFIHGGKGFDINKYISPEQIRLQNLAMAEVIKSSVRERQAVVQDADVKHLMPPLFEELARLYGKDVAMFFESRTGKTDDRRLCQMEAAWLRMTLRLPPDDAGLMLRFMVSKS